MILKRALSVLLCALLVSAPVSGQSGGQFQERQERKPLAHDHVLAIVDQLEPELQDLLVKDYLALFEIAASLPEDTRARLASAAATLKKRIRDAQLRYETETERMEKEHELLVKELERTTKDGPLDQRGADKERGRIEKEIRDRDKKISNLEKKIADTEKSVENESNQDKRRKLEERLVKFRAELGGLRNERAVLRGQLDSAAPRSASDWQADKKIRQHALRCQIQSVSDSLIAERITYERMKAAFEHAETKIDLLLEWPESERQINANIAAGKFCPDDRLFCDFENIGFRVLGGKGWKSTAKDQAKDVQIGDKYYKYLVDNGLLKQLVEDKETQDYVRGIVNKILANSDVKVPLAVHVLDDEEINAWTFPGYIFINKGLILAAENEAQLAGVIAHEIAHNPARHMARMQSSANKRGWLMNAAMIAILVVTGGYGAIAIAAYYGLQGAQILLIADLLKKSRWMEKEADALGAQYAFRSGYDPRAFTETFDLFSRMSKRDPRAQGWFTTHPSSYSRMRAGYAEWLYLQATDKEKAQNLIIDTPRFQEIKNGLRAWDDENKKKKVQLERDRPTLERKIPREEGCPVVLEPQKTTP